MKTPTIQLTLLLLSFLIICDQFMKKCSCQEMLDRIQTINCLRTDKECHRDQQNIVPVFEDSSNEDIGYQSELDIPLPRPGEDLGEDILESDHYVGNAKPGHLCDTDDDCDFGLRCIPLTSTESFSFQQQVCALVNKGKCSYSYQGLECPQDSFIHEFEFNGECFLFCKCLPINVNDTCQHRSSGDCTNHSYSDSYSSPGNCCPECLDIDTQSQTTNPTISSLNKHCNVSIPNGSGNLTEMRNGSKWIQISTTDSKTPCVECHCKDGAQLCNNTYKTQCPFGQECITQEQLAKLTDNFICCPICKPCFFKETHYNHSQSWISKDSDCQTCTCKNSKTICHDYACKASDCTDKESKLFSDGDCCPTCVCKLYCPYGQATDSNGMKLCSCLEENPNISQSTVLSESINKTNDHSNIDPDFIKIILYCMMVVIICAIIFLILMARFLFPSNQTFRQNRHSGSEIRSTDPMITETLITRSLKS